MPFNSTRTQKSNLCTESLTLVFRLINFKNSNHVLSIPVCFSFTMNISVSEFEVGCSWCLNVVLSAIENAQEAHA